MVNKFDFLIKITNINVFCLDDWDFNDFSDADDLQKENHLYINY